MGAKPRTLVIVGSTPVGRLYRIAECCKRKPRTEAGEFRQPDRQRRVSFQADIRRAVTPEPEYEFDQTVSWYSPLPTLARARTRDATSALLRHHRPPQAGDDGEVTRAARPIGLHFTGLRKRRTLSRY